MPPHASSCLLMPHCPLAVHSVVTGAPLLINPISTCGVIETRVSSCQGLGHHCTFCATLIGFKEAITLSLEGKWDYIVEAALRRHFTEALVGGLFAVG
ncbi:hypothetical protein NQZ68_017090 [Dissostichus eleginoides]|nr:hypothetical protein NQZ68_017090 [Dissostichus eleginoides]